MTLNLLYRESPGIFDKAIVLKDDELRELRNFMAENLQSNRVVLEEDFFKFDAQDDEVSKRIRQFTNEQDFYVYINHNDFALKMSFDHFIANFYDLFLAGADDVYLMDTRREFIILLDHEEIIKIYALA